MKGFLNKICVVVAVILCLTVILSGCSSKLDFKGAMLAESTVGKSYEQNIAVEDADGVTYTAEAGSLPSGLSLSANGVLSGVPSAKGEKSFTISKRVRFHLKTIQWKLP